MPQVVLGGDDQVRVSQVQATQLAEHEAEGRLRIRIVHIIENAAGRETDSHAVGTPHFAHGFRHFKRQPGTLGRGAAIFVGAMIGSITQELIE